MIKLLIGAKADVTRVNFQDETALDYCNASKAGKYEESLAVLKNALSRQRAMTDGSEIEPTRIRGHKNRGSQRNQHSRSRSSIDFHAPGPSHRASRYSSVVSLAGAQAEQLGNSYRSSTTQGTHPRGSTRHKRATSTSGLAEVKEMPQERTSLQNIHAYQTSDD